MKKQILFIATCLAFAGFSASAQVSLQINIGSQPVWGPTGYDHVDYYYMPDVDAYYDVPHQQYVYMENNAWVTRPNLPPRYANYDLYNGHKVVINESQPWLHNDKYRTQYAQYKGRHDQQAIRDSRDNRYYANPGHPNHSQWKGDNGRGNQGQPGNGRGQQNGPGNNNGKGNEHGNDEGHGGNEGHGGDGDHGRK